MSNQDPSKLNKEPCTECGTKYCKHYESDFDRFLSNQTKEPPIDIEICQACGSPNVDPSLFSEEEIRNAKLTYCGCMDETDRHNPTPRELYEAGIISKSEYENL